MIEEIQVEEINLTLAQKELLLGNFINEFNKLPKSIQIEFMSIYSLEKWQKFKQNEPKSINN